MGAWRKHSDWRGKLNHVQTHFGVWNGDFFFLGFLSCLFFFFYNDFFGVAIIAFMLSVYFIPTSNAATWSMCVACLL